MSDCAEATTMSILDVLFLFIVRSQVAETLPPANSNGKRGGPALRSSKVDMRAARP
jgi:hypothetical protein